MIDAHLHLQRDVLLGSLESILDHLDREGITRLVVNGTSGGDWETVERLAADLETVVPFFGVHPWEVQNQDDDVFERLEALLCRYPCAGVGEVGLDKWIRNADLTLQRRMLMIQLELAESFKRPATIHCLQAWGSLQECLRETSFEQPFLLHSFSGPQEMISWFLDRGAFFSLSGHFFREEKRQKLEVFRSIPSDRILLETDAPDMLPPEAMRRERVTPAEDADTVNHPVNIVSVYEAYASWSRRSMSDVIDQIETNYRRFASRIEPTLDFSEVVQPTGRAPRRE